MRKSRKIKPVKKINKLFKCSCKNRTFHRKRKTCKTRKRMRGGNYAKDVTMTELEGIASKSLDRITVVTPGSVMSGSAYKKHMEYLDMNGTDIE